MVSKQLAKKNRNVLNDWLVDIMMESSFQVGIQYKYYNPHLQK